MTTQLLLIRHGESVWNADGRMQGQSDPPLSELGRLQARALGLRLANVQLAALYTSPALRARDTSNAIADASTCSIVIEKALSEVHLGAWQGAHLTDLPPEAMERYRAWERDPAAESPPGGEDISSALHRVAPLLNEILEIHMGASIALVTHSIIGRVALSYLLDAGTQLVPRLRLKKASVTKLRVQNGIVVMDRLSDTSHLRSLS